MQHYPRNQPNELLASKWEVDNWSCSIKMQDVLSNEENTYGNPEERSLHEEVLFESSRTQPGRGSNSLTGIRKSKSQDKTRESAQGMESILLCK